MSVQPEPSTRGPELEPEHLSDLGNARRLVRLFGNGIIHVRPWRKWLTWVGTHWQVDETGEVVRLAKNVVAGLYAEAGYEVEDPERRAALGRHAMQSESVRALRAMIELAETEPGISVLPEQLDRDPWLFNVLNGTLDLRTITLRPHDRRDLITRV